MILVASSLILAIRSARYSATQSDPAAAPDWDHEVEESVTMAHRIFAHLISKSPFLFPHREVPFRDSCDGAPK